MKLFKSNFEKLRTTLLTGCLSIFLGGCTTSPTKPIKPPKPRLDVYSYGEKVCFTKEDAQKLGKYILMLEVGYD